MIILISLTVCLIGSIVWYKKSGWEDEMWPMIIAIVSGVGLFLALVTLPITRMDCASKILEFKSVQETFDKARLHKDNIERFSRLDFVIQSNKWLRSQQYYNKTAFDIWIPDEVDSL